MTHEEWLEYAELHASKLIALIKNYHPVNLDQKGWPDDLEITARSPELACNSIRQDIAGEEDGLDAPELRFVEALRDGNVDAVNSLLSAAWFGVPESRDCWQITGFREAVRLLEDAPPPEEEEYCEA